MLVIAVSAVISWTARSWENHPPHCEDTQTDFGEILLEKNRLAHINLVARCLSHHGRDDQHQAGLQMTMALADI